MSGDYLKLTTYFGERQHADTRFLADALLDFYSERRVASSIMLRGVSGFGLRHHLRTDQSLSLSADPPVAVIAVDSAATIDSLLQPVLAMQRRGMVTLQRTALLGDDLSQFVAAREDHDATKLTICVGRKERIGGVPAHLAICDLLYRNGITGASVFLGVDGTRCGERTRARFFSRNPDVPMIVVAVGIHEQLSRVLLQLDGLLSRPAMTQERVQLCKRDGELIARPHALPGVDENGLAVWQKLTVYTSEADLYEGQPLHRAVVRRLRQSRASHGATVLRGIWGFNQGCEPHGDKLFQLSRRVPVVTVVIDAPKNIAAAFDVIDKVTQSHGLVTSEMVPAQLTLDGDRRRGDTGMSRYQY